MKPNLTVEWEPEHQSKWDRWLNATKIDSVKVNYSFPTHFLSTRFGTEGNISLWWHSSSRYACPMGVPLGILSWEVLVRSPKCNRKDLYAICSYPSLKKVGYVPLYTFRKSLLDIQRLGFWNHLAQHISQTRFTLCRFTWSGFGFHLITAVSVIKKLIWIYSLSGAEILCPLSILERVCVIEVFFKENIKWEFFRDIGNCP